MRLYLIITFAFLLAKVHSQDTIKVYNVKKIITSESKITDWVQSLPDSITTYVYSNVEFENRNGKIVQKGSAYDWDVQLYVIDMNNGYIAANGYLPGTGMYTPEEQFVIFKRANNQYMLAYHFLGECFRVKSSVRFFVSDKSHIYELNSQKILPKLKIWDFVNMDKFNNLKRDYPEIDKLLNEMLIVYYLPQNGTSIKVGVSTLAFKESPTEYYEVYNKLRDSIESMIGVKWQLNGHELFGCIELKWNKQNTSFER